MRILLLGATGRTGKLILEKALVLDLEINVLVRNAKKVHVRSNKLTVFEGDTTNLLDLQKAISGCNTVISALNISRNSDFPWAKLRTPKDFLFNTIQNLLEIHKKQKIDKIIIISAWGVAETKKDIPFWFRWLINCSNIKYGYLGHEQQENLLKNSQLNWTSVRPVGLTNSNIKKEIVVTVDNIPRPSLIISRNNTAEFLLKVLQENNYQQQAITISEK